MMIKIVKWLLVAVIPFALYVQFFGTKEQSTLLFILSAIAVLPIATWIGHSTEHLAGRMGSTWGALFNATFGNLAEMIIALLAVRAGLPDVVKASFTGSILGNLLFVGGLSMLFGGWKRESQTFNVVATEAQAGQLVLAVAALLVPTVFFRVGAGSTHPLEMHRVSLGVSVILLVVYVLGLFFTFKTHSHLMGSADHEEESGHMWPVGKAVAALLASSALMGLVAEGLVRAVEHVGHEWGMNEVFLGFVVIAIVGNAAEHSTAVTLAIRNKMDTSLGIVMQSSVQIALFVTPAVVFASYPLGHPLDLVFTTFEVLAIALAVAIFAYLLINGESNWFEGVQLLALYLMIAVAIYFLPMGTAAAGPQH
jgi:Ca2+:H+ antiporter